MQFFTSFVLSALIVATASAQPGSVAVRAAAQKPAALPALHEWAETAITAVFTATSPAALNDAYELFWADDVSIVLNGLALSTKEYSDRRSAQGFSGTSTIQFTASFDQPTVANSTQAGLVSLFFTNAVPGMPAVDSTMNLIIRPDPFAKTADTRRVYFIDQVAAVKA
ncbi:hypothetical protein B0H16DRAFT_1691902 [Mycena metata]|uniref:SnoaL-like domain-containing protein n=1 Tax=Mycena metata TaxID=1033252 RepID=A0AAD7N743_9AGAR|nr:hypothetical protein B0H16DRAFT_1691902 [Mycena metata]